MKKKIKDLTIGNWLDICEKQDNTIYINLASNRMYPCQRCPLYKICRAKTLNLEDIDLEREVEVDE